MKAFWVRVSAFVNLLGVLVALLALPAGIYLALAGPTGWRWLSGPLVGITTGLILVGITMSVVAAAKYKRSAMTVDYQQSLSPLLQSQQEYCLVLRPFGHDGQIIVPDLQAKFGASTWLFRRNVTMEQVVAKAAGAAVSLKTYGIVDQQTLMAPPGLTFLRVPNSEWQGVAQQLIARAHSIVLILPPVQNIGDGFSWEIRQIIALGRRSRVAIVLPPSDQDNYAHQLALGHAGAMLATLEGSDQGADFTRFAALDYQLRLDVTTVAIKCRQQGGVATWSSLTPAPEPRRATNFFRRHKAVVANTTYLPCLAEAMTQTERELSAMSFASRYPPQR